MTVVAPPSLDNFVEQHTAPIYRRRHWDIDWVSVAKRRKRVLNTIEDMPKYLVLPEIQMLMAAALNDQDHFMIDTLWHTGARVSELLALTPASFTLGDGPNECYVLLESLKKRTRGRPRKGSRPNAGARREVPLTDTAYVHSLRRYFATFPMPKEARIFDFTRQTANNRIKRVAETVERLPFIPSAHTLRHSFAINALLYGTPLRVLQRWLGHENVSTTEIYTNVLATETDHFMGAVQFNERDAIEAFTPVPVKPVHRVTEF